MPTSNVVLFPVTPQCEPSTIQSIDLNRIHEGAIFVVTTTSGAEYYLKRDPSPDVPEGKHDPAMASVLVMMAPFGGEFALDTCKLYAHSIVQVDKPWHLGGDDYTDPITKIELVPGV